MGITILKSVGLGAVNNAADLIKVDNLLRTAGVLDAISPTQQTRNEAIKCFQEMWMPQHRADGKIDPNGPTLRKLNEAAEPLKLDKVTQKKIGKGGYRISYSPDAPPRQYQVWLGVSSMHGDYIDITGCDRKDVMTQKNLPDLLRLIKKRNAWGGNLELRLFVVLKGKVLTTSAGQQLACPVAPHNGKLLPLDDQNNGPALAYQGDAAAKSFEGRWLQKVDGSDGYFFAYFFDSTGDSNFETNSAKRGFDCITYAGSVCGVPPTHLGATSRLLDYLNPTKCSCEKVVPAEKPGLPATKKQIQLENADAKDIAEFFKTNNVGYYLMWDGGHVVLVADGFVHEFSASQKGYRWARAEEWLEKRGKMSVRKLGSKPAKAV